jgi:multiphosphoryl transfer protein
MVGIVLVSHSALIAEGTAQLARQMGGDAPIAAAGGIDDPDDPIGTDATKVLAAIEEAWSEDGVVVLMDLGSAILSADFALEMLDDDRRSRVVLCEAPLVEGAVAAATAAGAGLPLEGVLAEARAALLPKASGLGIEPSDHPSPATPWPPLPSERGGEARVVLTVGNTTGLHARPAARFVATVSRFDADVSVSNVTTGSASVRGDSFTAVCTLGARQGHTVEVTAVGPDADEVLAALQELAATGFGDESAGVTPATGDGGSPTPPPTSTAGPVGASPGTVYGPARHLAVPDLEAVDAGPLGTPTEERNRLDAALAAVRTDIGDTRTVAGERAGDAEAGIFDAHLMLLDDTELLDEVAARIAGGEGAVPAWLATITSLADRFRGLEDEYQRGRAIDVEAVGRQVLAAMLGVDLGVEPSGSGILVAADLDPGQTARLDPAVVTGILTAEGGPTSHAAILARSLGIPAVVAAGRLVLDIPEGTTVLIDGATGEVVADPGPERLRLAEAAAHAERERAAAAAALAHEPSVTIDGTVIEVAANIGSVAEAAAAVSAGADGVGLLRTEFLFLGRDAAPDEAEQEATYRSIAEAMGGRRLVVRTLDIGGDKPVPFAPQPREANPFLGVRGLRLGLRRADLLATQLRAIARVAADHRISVMFPMVTTVAELLAARAMLDAAFSDLALTAADGFEVGVMVEVPAVAVLADRIAPHVDFFSIGTNDLTQYAMAAERGHPALAAMSDPLHPAVLRLIGAVCAAAAAHGVWVGVCGEAGGDVAAAPVLIGLGVGELSAAVTLVPAVKQAVRAVDLTAARELAKAVGQLDDAPAVRRRVEEFVGEG